MLHLCSIATEKPLSSSIPAQWKISILNFCLWSLFALEGKAKRRCFFPALIVAWDVCHFDFHGGDISTEDLLVSKIVWKTTCLIICHYANAQKSCYAYYELYEETNFKKTLLINKSS